MVADKPYPAVFASKVKAVFPNSPRLHEALDAGGEIVGRYLSDSRGDVNAEEVVRMIDAGQVQELRTKAQRLVDILNLYREWQTIAGKMFYNR